MLPPLVEFWPQIDPDVCILYMETQLLQLKADLKRHLGRGYKEKKQNRHIKSQLNPVTLFTTSQTIFLRLRAFIAIIQYRVCIILTPNYCRFDSLYYGLVIITKAILGPATVFRDDVRKLQPVIPICKTSRFHLAPITYLAHLHWCINK